MNEFSEHLPQINKESDERISDQEVHKEFLHVLDDFLSGKTSDLEMLCREIDTLRYRTGLNDSTLARLVTARPRILLETICDWFEARAAESFVTPEPVERAACLLTESLYQRSEGPDSLLDMATRLRIISRVTRNKVLARNFGPDMVRSYVYSLTIASDQAVGGILDGLVELDIAEQLDIIHQLTAIGGAAGGIHDYDTKAATANAISLIQGLEMNSDAALIELACKVSSTAMKAEYEAGRQGGKRSPNIVRTQRDKLDDRFLELHEALRRQVRTEPTLPRDYRLYPVSPELVAVLDPALLPVGYVHAKPSDLPQTFGVLPENLDYFENIFRSRRLPTPYGAIMMFHDFMSEIVLPTALDGWDPPVDVDVAIKVAQDTFPDFTAIWNRIFLENPGEDEGLVNSWRSFSVQALVYVRATREKLVDRRPIISIKPIEALSGDKIVSEMCPGVTTEELLLLRHLHNPEMRMRLEEKLHIAMGNVPIYAQMSLMRYLSVQSMEDIERLGAIFVRAKANENDAILASFLACREDRGSGDLIIELLERLPLNQSAEVFNAFKRVLDAANIAEAVYARRWGQTMNAEDAKKIVVSLRKRAVAVLEGLGRRFLNATKSNQFDTGDIEAELAYIESDIVATTTIARELKLDPVSAEGSSAGFLPGSAAKGLLAAALKIQEAQYARHPESFKKIVRDGLERAFGSGNTDFFTVQIAPDSTQPKKTELAGLFRLDSVKNERGEVDHLYFASMLVNPKYSGVRIMANRAREALAQKAKDKLITAECFPAGADITHEYFEWGFVATGVTNDSKIDLLKIEWNAERNALLKTTAEKMSREQIIRRVGSVKPGKHKNAPGIMYRSHESEPDFRALIPEGYVLTRYFKNPNGGKIKYFTVIEEDPLAKSS